jgi:hypothetical protein
LEFTANKIFVQEEAVAWATQEIITNIANTASVWFNVSLDEDLYRKNSGLIVDGLVFDLVQGGNGKTIANADEFSLAQSINAVTVDRISQVVQSILLRTSISPSSGNTEVTTSTGLAIESGSDGIVADLLQAASRIIDLDPDYNPAKNNADLDVLLCNDANVIRYISCQNHGGFMQVLDPVGQIKNKSPYTQTASSFSQSIAKQRFAGGMFVDGFSGNVTATVVDFVSDPLTLEITGLRRRPQVPTFFMNRGVRYEVSFFADYQPDYTLTSSNNITEQFYSAKLRLNPLNPGGIRDSVIVNDAIGGFTTGTTIPILVEQPAGAGGLVATGFATSNSSGFITDIVIDFPGSGYISTPFISVGGAIFNNLSFSGDSITGVNIVTGGSGYTVGTTFEIVPVGVLGGVRATGVVATVNATGGITSVTFLTNGSGWNSGIGYRVAFGDLDIIVPAPTPGFIDSNIPDTIEMITAGNRSMLANDFTQINDLGYAIFCTNGSYMENVSMFTYYCYRSYFALNGAQIRTTTGSTCYGEFGLVSDGSDPMEVPIAVTQALPLVQIASAYVSNPLFPAQQGQSSIYVEIDPLNGGYPPLNNSVVEINHNGIRKNYSIGSAGPALDGANVEIPNVYQLLFNTGNVAAGNDNIGLLTSVNDGDTVIIRTGGLLRLLGFNPASITRPATTLTWNDDPTEAYFITEFTPPQPDGSVLTYTASEYNYIVFQTVPQGIVTPTLTFGGIDYSTATTTINIGTGGLVSGVTSTADGTQGVLETIQNIQLTSTVGIIPGHIITGTNILAESFVTFVNSVDNIICINQPTSGTITNGAVLTFTASQPVAVLTITTGSITNIVVAEGGSGWNVASTTVSISGTGTGVSVVPTVAIAGVVGSSIIKITSLDLTSANRIRSGLVSSPVRYYQFALGDQIYEITGYRSSSELNAAWAEIDITPPLQETITQGIILRAGIPANSKGSITTRISIMRASGHDFVLIGTGGYATTRYPNDLYGPPLQQPSTAREVVESNRGRVFYVSTDQDGNFRVGRALTVNQNKGSVSISVPLDLSNLSSISLRRDLGPTVTEFSIDGTMVSEADFKVPTEQAVVTYINRRLGIDRNGSVYAGTALGPQFMALSGVLPMKGAMNMANFGIINLNTPRAGIGSDAANKDYADGKISNAGTAGIDTDNITRRPEWGRMTGSLQLFSDPVRKTAVVATTITTATSNITFVSLTSAGNYRPGDFLRHRVIGVGIPDNTYVGVVFQDGLRLGLSTIDEVAVLTTATIPAGTVISFDPIFQAVTKRVVDENRQFSQLVDVSLTGAQDQDFVMFNNVVIAANSATNPPIYTTATQLINVSNNDGINPTNTPTGESGGSDVFFNRTGNVVTIKLVGGTANAANNPITDFHVNSFAQIQQAKLKMNFAATAPTPTVGTQTQIQNTMGVALFDSRMFTATDGWITLVDSTGTTSGVQTTKQAWVPTGGGFLGATNTAANTPATYVNSATMKTWLGNESTAWEFTGDLTPKTDGVQRLGTGAKRWQNLFISSTATIDGGIVVNTLARISTNQTTAEIFTATVTTLNLGSAATTMRIGGTSGTLTIGNPTVVGTQAAQTLFDTVATAVQAFSSATTLTIGSGTAATVTLRPGTLVGVNATQNVYNTVATTVNAFGAATTITVGAAGANTFTLNHGTLVGSQTTQNVFNTVATTVNAFNAATTLSLGRSASTFAIGTSTGVLTISNPTVVGTQATQAVFNSVATTVNAFGAASTLNMGVAGGTTTILGTTRISVLSADADGNSSVTGAWTLQAGATFQATYADLAEWYGSDAEYEPGTVLIFGGESEVTLTTLSNDSRVAGVVTTDPAYIMNVGQEGTRACIALQGRVPVKVTGVVRKGDLLTTSSTPGYACKAMNPTAGTLIGKALEDKNDPGTGTIQVAIGRM